jgi:hypothetical protein
MKSKITFNYGEKPSLVNVIFFLIKEKKARRCFSYVCSAPSRHLVHVARRYSLPTSPHISQTLTWGTIEARKANVKTMKVTKYKQQNRSCK